MDERLRLLAKTTSWVRFTLAVLSGPASLAYALAVHFVANAIGAAATGAENGLWSSRRGIEHPENEHDASHVRSCRRYCQLYSRVTSSVFGECSSSIDGTDATVSRAQNIDFSLRFRLG